MGVNKLKAELGKERKKIQGRESNKRSGEINNRKKGMDKLISEVKKLAMNGLFNYQIGHALGINESAFSNILNSPENTLIRDAINQGRAQAVNKAANVLYEIAIEERNVDALKFFLKTVGGFKENADPLVQLNLLNGSIDKEDKIKEINDSMSDDEVTQAYMELCKAPARTNPTHKNGNV